MKHFLRMLYRVSHRDDNNENQTTFLLTIRFRIKVFARKVYRIFITLTHSELEISIRLFKKIEKKLPKIKFIFTGCPTEMVTIKTGFCWLFDIEIRYCRASNNQIIDRYMLILVANTSILKLIARKKRNPFGFIVAISVGHPVQCTEYST